MRPIRVFLSYSSEDKKLARRIAKDLRSRTIVVWFDEWEIHVGDSITQKIERGLDKADFVAVLFTKHSVNSGWVRKEWQPKIGQEAAEQKVIVLPLKGDSCRIPALLQDNKYADFVKDYTAGLDALLKAIEAHSKQKIPNLPSEVMLPVERIAELSVGGIPLPCFFPSVSGAAKNALSPLEHIEIINAVRYPHYLISAYDISDAKRDERLKVQRLLEKSISRGQVVLMDSGVYEKKWLHDENWKPSNFYETLRNTPCHFAFCFDDPDAKGNADQIAGALARSVVKDRKKGDMTAIEPLVHTKKPAQFPLICRRIAEQLDPAMIVVPERELGDGVLEIAKTMQKIREALNETGQHYPVHIVGTGNPLSILIYAACGADSFDGLDWCQTVVDHETGRLYHSLQLDFFAHQTSYGAADLRYLPRALAHNLVFYVEWMEKIRKAITEGSIGEMILEFIPSEAHSTLKELLPEIVKSKTGRAGRARK